MVTKPAMTSVGVGELPKTSEESLSLVSHNPLMAELVTSSVTSRPLAVSLRVPSRARTGIAGEIVVTKPK